MSNFFQSTEKFVIVKKAAYDSLQTVIVSVIVSY